MEIKKYQQQKRRQEERGIVQIEEKGIVQIDEEKFRNYIENYNKMLLMLKNTLIENVDYGLPYPGAPKAVLLLPGAEKLFAYAQLEILQIIDEEIRKGDEIWGFKFKVLIGRKDGRQFWGVGIASYTEPKMWNLDKKTNQKVKKEENFLYQMAYKRAFVKAVIKAFGLSGIFTEEEFEEEETKKENKENKEVEIEGGQALREFTANFIKSHFLPADKWIQMIDYICEKGRITEQQCKDLINWIRDKEMVIINGEKRINRTKERLIEIAKDWIRLAQDIEDFEETVDETMTISEIKKIIDKAREITGYGEKFKKAQNIILNK